jgi:integrase
MRPLSEEEARSFLEAAKGDAFEAPYCLAITAGLRRGELLALRWDHADFARGTLRVGCSLTRERGRYLLGDTKTKKGRRRVNLTSRTVAALKAHRKRQLEERVRYAGLREDRGLIFSTQTGAIVSPENLVKRSFKPLLKRAGLPEIRFHDLRLTCATTL